MQIQIERSRIESIVVMIIERWSGAPLNNAQRLVLHDFMELEVQPLDRRQLLRRMATPDSILAWYLAFSRSRIPGRFCRRVPDSKAGYACYAA